MRSRIALLIYYSNKNKYSFNALVGSIEANKRLSNLPIHFASSEEDLLNALGKLSAEHAIVVVALSFFTTQIWDIYRLINNLRKSELRNILLVAGGPHPTGDPRGTLRMGFDLVVRGEAEESFAQLLIRISEDRDISDIKGIAHLDENGHYTFTGRASTIDLNHYPPFSKRYRKLGHIEITRGCPYVCSFCQTPLIHGGRVRHRSISKICDSLSILKSFGYSDFRFITPNAFSYGSKGGREVELEMIEALLASSKEIAGIEGKVFFGSFPSEVRPEHVSVEILKLVKDYADNKNLIIGAQSGSQRVLELCNRGHSVDDIYRSVTLTIEAGLTPNVDFIFGLPGETEDDTLRTIDVMKDIVSMGARIHAHSFLPLPQTPFAKSPVRRIAQRVVDTLDAFITQGSAYGSWREQEKIADRVSKYLRTGEINANKGEANI